VKPANISGTKKREYLKGKINELATNSKNMNIRDLHRGINECKSGYQPRSNLVEDENGDLLADSNSIVNRSKCYFSQILNVQNISGITLKEIYTAEQLVPGPSHLVVEIAVANLEKYKSLGSDQIPTELIEAGGEILVSVIHKLIYSIWNEEELPDQWKKSIIVPVHKKGDKRDCNNCRGISLLLTSYKIISNILPSRLSPYIDEIIGHLQCGFRRNRSDTDQMFFFHQILVKNGSTTRQYVSYS
jgi:hypothetical protein